MTLGFNQSAECDRTRQDLASAEAFSERNRKREYLKTCMCTYHALQTEDLHVVTHGVVLFRHHPEWPNVLYIHQHLQG